MKQLGFLSILLITSLFVFGQANKKVAQGNPFTNKIIARDVKKGVNVKSETSVDFQFGVSEFNAGKYKSALEFFNKHLAGNNDDFDAYYNRGLTYYFLEDIDHACMDWKYAAYMDNFYSKENYKTVCDTSIDMDAFMNGGLFVQSLKYDNLTTENAVEIPASFPGGETELNKFIRDNLKVSGPKRRAFLKSRIVVKFKVDKDGKVMNPVVLQVADSGLAAEAIRVASIMPKWNPATSKGKPVSSEYYYPIVNGEDSMRQANKFYREGIKFFEQSEFKSALALFTNAIQINAADDDAYFSRGQCYLNRGDTANACLDWNRPSLKFRVPVITWLNKFCGENLALDSLPSLKESGQLTYTIVEQMPVYKGGDDEMRKFLGENIKFPEEAKNKNITGRVYVSFVVDKDGYVRDPKVLRGIGGGCDEEAMRVVKSMPPWNPGYQNGRPVNVQYNLPIAFMNH